jgi:AcrR family transcriptional regulator
MEMVKEDTRSKRQAIIEAARKIFAMKGYEDTTIAEIAEDAGIAVGTVYLYFGNKRDIYTSVSLNWATLLAAAFEDPTIAQLSFEQVPRTMIEATFRICRQDSDMMSLFQVDIQSEGEIQKQKAADELITGILDNFFRQAVARGQLAPFDTEMYTKIIFGMVHSVLFQCFCVEGGEREEHFRERTIELIERLFFGPSLLKGKIEAADRYLKETGRND